MADLVELEFVTEELTRLSYLAKWNEKYRFYYLSQMTNQEVCIFKIFDSAALDDYSDEQRRTTLGCIHSAFKLNPATQSRPRESVEVRILLFSDT
ncbi:hypothetical protein DL768_000529 [Monosporascus sp. mg162]|nr:hypothetical protein DL768_000529 [Monosporascus sp. mg162]